MPQNVGGVDTSWLQLNGIGFSGEGIGLMARRSLGQTEDSNLYDLEGDDSWSGSGSSNGAFEPYNLGAIVGAGTSILASINDLRMAFAMQRVLELFARGGSRYVEMIRNFFHVIPDDASLQRPEYLGGHHIPLNISQVIQNSATSIEGSNTPLGQTGAMSKTVNAGKLLPNHFASTDISLAWRAFAQIEAINKDSIVCGLVRVSMIFTSPTRTHFGATRVV